MRQDWKVSGKDGERIERVWEPGQAAERYGRRYFAEALAKGEIPNEVLRVRVEQERGPRREYFVRCRIVVQADEDMTCKGPCQVPDGEGCGGACKKQDAHDGPCKCGTCDCEWGGTEGVRPGLG